MEQVRIDYSKTYFVHNFVSGNETCSGYANPDIAGLGVVFSFIISAFVATAASILIAILDSKIDKDDPTAFLPSRLKDWLSRGVGDDVKERCRFWRAVLEELILTLADQQLVTGMALLISMYINIPMNPLPSPGGVNFQDAYSTLVVYLSCLSSCTHIACIITLKKYINSHKVTTYIRLVLIIIFALMLLVAPSVNENAFLLFFRPFYIILVNIAGMNRHAYSIFSSTTAAILLAYLFWVSIVNLTTPLKTWISSFVAQKCSPIRRIRWVDKICDTWYGRKLKAVCSFCLFSTPLIIFIIQIGFAVVSLVFALAQKFSVAPEPNEQDLGAGVTSWCDLNSAADNRWSFGQSTAMLLLFIPVLYGIETYCGKILACGSEVKSNRSSLDKASDFEAAKPRG